MDNYAVGATGVTLSGTGGTWKSVDSQNPQFILWESEKYGDAAGRVLTDGSGNILLKGVSSLSDFRVQVFIAQQKKESIQLSSEKKNGASVQDPEMDRKATSVSVQNVRSGKRKKPKDICMRESVIAKLHKYQNIVEKNRQNQVM